MFNLYKKITRDIWLLDENKQQGKKKPGFIRFLKIFILSIRGFGKNNVVLRASALTYYTIFSIVPVLALAFAVCKGFGLDNKLHAELITKFNGHEILLSKIMIFTENLLAKTKGSVIAGVGVFLLLWSIIRLFENIEKAFNTTWKQKKERSFYRKITDYLSLSFVAPLLLIVSGGFQIFINTNISEYIFIPTALKILVSGLCSHIMIWLLFTFMYKIMPNCKVSLKAAVIPGIIAGTTFSLTQFVFFNFQIFITSYNAIYGSFAAFPLFLLWTQISWLIVLFGAELSYAIENIELHEYDYTISSISHKQKKLLALQITNIVIKNFKEGKEPLLQKDISRNLSIPYGLTVELLDELVCAGILSLVINNETKITGYQPARSIGAITLQYVIEKLESSKEANILQSKTDFLKKINDSISHFDSIVKKDSNNIPP